MIMAVGLTVSKGQRSDRSGDSEMDHNWLYMQFRTI